MSADGGSDAEFLGLEREAAGEVFGFVVEPHLARLDGQLYGGTAIAASITAAELTANVWSEDGTLMATASQTAAMMRFDLTQLPWHGRGD